MNPAALSPALFTAPAAQAQPGAGSPQSGSQDAGQFSQLLGASPVPTADDAPVLAPPPATGPLAGDNAADAGSLDDAPWPPAGLETLLALPATAPAPAPVAPLLLDGGTAAAMAVPTALAAVISDQPLTGTPSQAMASALTQAAPAPGAAAQPPAPLPAAALQANPTLTSSNDADNLALATADALLGPAPGSTLQAVPALPTADNGGLVAMAALAATAGAHPLPATDSQASVLPTRADMGGEHFDADVAQGVEYMLDHKLQSARIRISPQQMGMIEVELRLDGDRVHANFSSAHADVRQALHEALPRLREMLDASGLQMGQAAVGDHAAGQQPGATAAHGQAMAGSTTGHGDGEPSADTAPAPVWRHNRLLDTYA